MKTLLLILSLLCVPAMAEYAQYGSVELNGLARSGSWQQGPGIYYSMVCNVNGPDGFLSVRSGPGTNYPIQRNLKRLAIMVVNTEYRQGNWVWVQDAYRTHTQDGDALARPKDLPVSGWAHSDYMCDFIF